MNREIKVGDYVVYQHPTIFKEGEIPSINITLEKVVDIGIKNFKNHKLCILKKHRIRKITGDESDYFGYDPMRIAKEDYVRRNGN